MLMLVPAAVLVLMVLAAIAVDAAVAFLAQRELGAAAAAAANDAATAISEERFYRAGPGRSPALSIDELEARRVVDAAVAARTGRGVHLTAVSVETDGRRVCVALVGRAPYVFAKAVPGVPHEATVRGRASATAVEGPPGTPVSSPALCGQEDEADPPE